MTKALHHAPAWKRLIAYLIDILGLNFLSTILILLFEIPTVIHSWIFFALYLSYNILMDFSYGGSFGKRMMKIKVVQINGQPPSLKISFYRNFGKIISALPLCWGFIRLLTPSYPQGIHDEIARCYVVEKTITISK